MALSVKEIQAVKDASRRITPNEPEYRPRTKRRRKKSLAQAVLPELLQTQCGRCHWCGIEIWFRQALGHLEEVSTKLTRTALWAMGRKFSFATVDHVIPKAVGGTNKIDNLVAACGPCNHYRCIRQQDFNKKMERTCKGCGEAYDRRSSGSCLFNYCLWCKQKIRKQWRDKLAAFRNIEECYRMW